MVTIRILEGLGSNADSVELPHEFIESFVARGCSSMREGATSSNNTATVSRRVLKSSTPLDDTWSIVPYGNGFIETVVRAWQQNLHLTIRPEDVWLSIITQIRLYLDDPPVELGKSASAEKPVLTEKAGSTENPVSTESPVSTAFFGSGSLDKAFKCALNADPGDGTDSSFHQRMVSMLTNHLTQKNRWILPSFTTTSNDDVITAAVAALGHPQTYKAYRPFSGERVQHADHGFAAVTLLGDRKDWVQIWRDIKQYILRDNGMTSWAKLLCPIATQFINSFDHPDSDEVIDFWTMAVYFDGSGHEDPQTLSGWITAFCYWSNPHFCTDNEEIVSYADVNSQADAVVLCQEGLYYQRHRLWMSRQLYPLVSCDEKDQNHIPSTIGLIKIGIADSNCSKNYEATMVAGHFGMSVDKKGSVAQPAPGWFLLEDSAKTYPRIVKTKNKVSTLTKKVSRGTIRGLSGLFRNENQPAELNGNPKGNGLHGNGNSNDHSNGNGGVKVKEPNVSLRGSPNKENQKEAHGNGNSNGNGQSNGNGHSNGNGDSNGNDRSNRAETVKRPWWVRWKEYYIVSDV